MSNSTVRTAFVYTCRPDVGAAMTALSDLTGFAEERRYEVRAAVCDAVGTDLALGCRPAWRFLSRLVPDGGPAVLVVRSTDELAVGTAGRKAALEALTADQVRVEAVRPAAWEVSPWKLFRGRPGPLPRTSPSGGEGQRTRACHAVYPARPEHARAVRRLIAGVMDTWGAGLSQDADLVTAAANELVVNAIVHGSLPGDPVAVTVELGAGALRVSVGDRSPVAPLRRHPGHDGTNGRGLEMVQSIADAWGTTHTVDTDTPGKSVWMRLRTSREEPCPAIAMSASTAGDLAEEPRSGAAHATGAPVADEPHRVSLYALYPTEEGGAAVPAVLRRHAERAGHVVVGEHQDIAGHDAPEYPAWRSAWASVAAGDSDGVTGGDHHLLVPVGDDDPECREGYERLAIAMFRLPGRTHPVRGGASSRW
ncbi:ATP-binding protein [Streptomyces uncialis]|uniref:ATP-binding protein n=1 Tax=Streptomyces uncialis TaxID=1048205 RepID=UPI0038679060|nr:ATP-binding protein [Streptomyces uncialis]